MLHNPVVSSRVLFIIALMASSLVFGCNSEHDPTEPEGAYYTFRDAVLNDDAATAWERVDEGTREYYEERYAQLEEMDETIEQYLPQTDHRIAREQSGTELLEEVDDGEDLFKETFTASDLPDDEAIEVGTDIDELKLAEDEKSAKVITRAGQEYLLKRDEESGDWHVMLSESTDAVDESFKWLDKNRKALRKTVEDLMAEEREKREAIIAELMGKE